MPDEPKKQGQKVSHGDGGKDAHGQGEHMRPAREQGGKPLEKKKGGADR